MNKNYIKSLFSLIARGRDGKNKGLSMGLPLFEEIVDGVQRATYTCLAGGTGSGKTTFALYAYVYRILVDNMALGLDARRIKIIYYSLEMSAEILLAKLLSLHIYEQYGVEVSYKQIISKQDIVDDELYELITGCEPWLEEICEHLIIYDKALGAGGLYANVMQFANENGTWEEDDHSMIYKPNDPDELVEIIIDHMGLLRKGEGRTKKEEMDLASQFLITFRNKCNYSPLALFQLNRQSSSMDRRNANFQEIQLDDIKDTSGPSEDAEIVIAIFNPHREKLANYKGYNIGVLKDKFRALQVLKHRLGEADKSVAVNFFGSIGYWRELPGPQEMRRMSDRETEKYLHLTGGSAEIADDEQEDVDGGFTYSF
jgi:replicative DNA helicase